MTKYTLESTKLHHLKFSPHRDLEVRESNPLLAFDQSKLMWDLVRSIINLSTWRIIVKLRETMRKGECPEDV